VSAPSAQILVIRGGAIGDFIVTLPVLAALRNQFPASRIELVAYERVAQLALRSGLADAWRPIESRGLAGFFARNGVLEPEWQDYFAGFPIIISHLYDPDEIFQTNVVKSCRGQFLQSIHRPDETLPIHVTEQLLKPLERLAIFDADPVPRLALSGVGQKLPTSRPDHVETSGQPTGLPGPRPIIAIHPGSGSESKNWPVPRWQELLSKLVAEREDDFLVIGGEADRHRLEPIAAVIPEHRRQVLAHRPLAEVAEALAQARCFIGHDSGITHLAAAVGLPGVALWGDTNDQVWRPRNDGIRLLRHSFGLAQLAVGTVAEAFPR
jgi:ADP-heptose:LPS heptosyltransferase